MATVLVVDDHASNRELIVSLLHHAGHRSLEAVDGRDALEQVRLQRPDLVICDILMPTMDGYAFVRHLRAEPAIAHTEVIFYTATFMEREARQLADSCGVSKVLPKPCEPEEVLRMIELSLAPAAGPAAPRFEGEFDREHLRLMTDKLVLKVNELERTNQRLSALTDLNLLLASERDPDLLLDKVCRGARDLLGARGAVLAVSTKGDNAAAYVTSWGLGIDESQRLRGLSSIEVGLLGASVAQRRAQRFTASDGAEAGRSLPAEFPSLHNGLVAPIVSLNRTYGWIVMIDKLGADAFSDEDERILAIHAAQAGRIYENGSLYNEIKHTAEQLHLANDTLEQRVKLRTADLHEVIQGLESFNRSVSHDLQGPLSGIASAARMAREYVAESNPAKADRMLQAIVEQADITARMVDALLALARTSDASLKLRACDIDMLVRDVIGSLRPAASVSLDVAPRLGRVNADPDLARQVFVNLIGNALKFSRSAARPRVEIGVAGAPQRPVFHVSDNGVGFDPGKAKGLFEPFCRMHGSGFEGSGVGLSIVKRVVERHGGSVRAESAPGQGATFYFSFGEHGAA